MPSHDEMLRSALGAFPRTDWAVDEQTDYDDGGAARTCPVGIIVGSTPVAIAAGADDMQEIGRLYPDAAQRLAVEAVRAAPDLLRRASRLALLTDLLAQWRRDPGAFPGGAATVLERMGELAGEATTDD